MKSAPKIDTLQYRYVFRFKKIANYIDSPTMKQKTQSFSCVRCNFFSFYMTSRKENILLFKIRFSYALFDCSQFVIYLLLFMDETIAFMGIEEDKSSGFLNSKSKIPNTYMFHWVTVAVSVSVSLSTNNINIYSILCQHKLCAVYLQRILFVRERMK